MLTARWEAKAADLKYALFHDAIKAGLKKIKKYYMKMDDTRAYVLSHCKCFPSPLYVTGIDTSTLQSPTRTSSSTTSNSNGVGKLNTRRRSTMGTRTHAIGRRTPARPSKTR